MYTVILSYLRPAFLMHKNPHRRKIIQWMIDGSEDVYEENPLCVISVAVNVAVV